MVLLLFTVKCVISWISITNGNGCFKPSKWFAKVANKANTTLQAASAQTRFISKNSEHLAVSYSLLILLQETDFGTGMNADDVYAWSASCYKLIRYTIIGCYHGLNRVHFRCFPNNPLLATRHCLYC